MKEYVLCEFLIEEPWAELFGVLTTLDPDFIITDVCDEQEADEDGNVNEWCRVTGKIRSEFATVLKLQHAKLAERMRISYIPEDLKNKYRTGNR